MVLVVVVAAISNGDDDRDADLVDTDVDAGN